MPQGNGMRAHPPLCCQGGVSAAWQGDYRKGRQQRPSAGHPGPAARHGLCVDLSLSHVLLHVALHWPAFQQPSLPLSPPAPLRCCAGGPGRLRGVPRAVHAQRRSRQGLAVRHRAEGGAGLCVGVGDKGGCKDGGGKAVQGGGARAAWAGRAVLGAGRLWGQGHEDRWVRGPGRDGRGGCKYRRDTRRGFGGRGWGAIRARRKICYRKYMYTGHICFTVESLLVTVRPPPRVQRAPNLPTALAVATPFSPLVYGLPLPELIMNVTPPSQTALGTATATAS